MTDQPPDRFGPAGEPAGGARDVSGRWSPGVSGNPAGRPVGARSRRTVAMGQALSARADDLAAALLDQAIDQGSVPAARLMLDMLDAADDHEALSALSGLPVATPTDLTAVAERLTALAISGTLRPVTAARVLDLLTKAVSLAQPQEQPAKKGRRKSKSGDGMPDQPELPLNID